MERLDTQEMELLKNLLQRADANAQFFAQVEVEEGERNGVCGNVIEDVCVGDVGGLGFLSVCLNLGDVFGLTER